MDSIHVLQVSGQVPATTRQVYYTGTDALYEGYALCYDVTASEANRSVHVAKPTLNNCVEFAGVVAPGQTIPARTSGGTWVNIISVEGAIARGVNVYTDESITAGDLLGVIPGEFALGRCVIGQPVARALATVDRSVTAGVVNTQFGWLASVLTPEQIATKIVKHFDHFLGATTVAAAVASAVADQQTYLLTGTSSTAAYEDSSTAADQATAAQRGNGVLLLTPNTTNQANLTMNGEPFSIAAGQSVFFRARVAQGRIAATSGMTIGLFLTDTALISGYPSDYIAFVTADGAISLKYTKASASATSSSATPTMAVNEFRELAFMVRHKASGVTDVKAWIDGTAFTVTNTASNLPTAQSLTFAVEGVGSAAVAVRLDRVEINNYIG